MAGETMRAMVLERSLVDPLIRGLLVKLGQQFVAFVTRDLLLVERLQHELSRSRAGAT